MIGIKLGSYFTLSNIYFICSGLAALIYSFAIYSLIFRSLFWDKDVSDVVESRSLEFVFLPFLIWDNA